MRSSTFLLSLIDPGSVLVHYLPDFSSSSSFSLSPFPHPRMWLPSLARSSLFSVLEHAIHVGRLIIEDSDGTHIFGTGTGTEHDARITVIDPNFWMRVIASGDLGFSEAYMLGEIQVENLKWVMNIWLENQSGMKTLAFTLSRLATSLSGLSNAFFGQTISQARLNAVASYDQSNILFKAFLSQEMMYSCGLFSNAEGGVRGDLTAPWNATALESAQRRKIHHVLKKARVAPGHRILEFGSGWGGLAIEAAQTFGCSVDTLTLSIEQKHLAEERIYALGLQKQIRVHLLDYREIPDEWAGQFDAFISIEMLEHVGPNYYERYFEIVDFALKPQGATVVISSSTFPESRYSHYQSQDFMRKYMWPNSSLPSASALIASMRIGGKGRFSLESVENHAAHYPRTLREWGYRLEKNLTPEVIGVEYPRLLDLEDFGAFKRKWQYLFAYAGAGFAKGYISCHMLSFTRADDVPVSCD